MSGQDYDHYCDVAIGPVHIIKHGKSLCGVKSGFYGFNIIARLPDCKRCLIINRKEINHETNNDQVFHR